MRSCLVNGSASGQCLAKRRRLSELLDLMIKLNSQVTQAGSASEADAARSNSRHPPTIMIIMVCDCNEDRNADCLRLA